jgi:hypothetical protein
MQNLTKLQMWHKIPIIEYVTREVHSNLHYSPLLPNTNDDSDGDSEDLPAGFAR